MEILRDWGPMLAITTLMLGLSGGAQGMGVDASATSQTLPVSESF